MNTKEFQRVVREQGRLLYRDMPWRRDTQPYYVLVSELMLQQTQVERVKPKFDAFIARFPTVSALAKAALGDVLTLWNGLGYNRRAKYLHNAAKMIEETYNGTFPTTRSELLTLPGVGEGTAGAIVTYAFNQPVVFIETNVRTVYFHHFFSDGEKVRDSDIAVLVDQTLDKAQPREFYWALMDYGTWLKKQGAGRLQQSYHYKKQSALKGSLREMRGAIVRLLTQGDQQINTLPRTMTTDERFAPALTGLLRDGLIEQRDTTLHLTK